MGHISKIYEEIDSLSNCMSILKDNMYKNFGELVDAIAEDRKRIASLEKRLERYVDEKHKD